jgi:hypothetical protein
MRIGGLPVRKYAKKDDNQREIERALIALGASVTDTSTIGCGFVDLVVGFRGQNFLLEIKDGAKVPSKRKLTDDETTWHLLWRGQAHIVESVRDALDVVTK